MACVIFITVMATLVSTCYGFRTDCTDDCLSRGKCKWNGSGFYCVCYVGYYGDRCKYGFGGYPNAETTAMTSLVTPKQTTPLVGGNDQHPDIIMAVLYAAIALLIISFTVLTIRYRRQYESMRQQLIRRRTEGFRRSRQSRDLELANEATSDGPYSTVVMVSSQIQPPPYKELSSSLHDHGRIYDDPPPYELIVALDERVNCGGAGDAQECDAV
ncbi:uncharacterized protein LOC100377781 [Saccoglossus kowalevskii]|uniref:Uncharacterized protein LOC100377781 n=1 Tax=Saccoglossus kowalevskii TaxID=10224 RepID=A0ABM0GRL9_SACKO|nr:PREDICTED: uncharacterized protein LOC100377781 [Saccoglossus kowalevskii]